VSSHLEELLHPHAQLAALHGRVGLVHGVASAVDGVVHGELLLELLDLAFVAPHQHLRILYARCKRENLLITVLVKYGPQHTD